MKPCWTDFLFSSLAVAWFIAAIPLMAAEPAGPNQSLRYRRIYVPAGELNSQANGMIPLKREEFERRVTSGVARQSNSSAARVRVERATYSARLAAEQLVEGTALLEIVNGSNEAVPFSWESTLPMGKPVWEEQPSRAARLGSTQEGGSVLMVEKSGRLAFPWSLRGKTSEAEGLAFDLHLPKAAISRVVLQFPAGVMPETEEGIVSLLDPSATESRLLPSTANSTNINWLVELGGLTQVRLRARNSSQAAQASGVVLVRESATHVLSPVDANSDFELQLETHQHSLSSIKLELDAPARVTGVRLGGMPVYWREATAPDSQRIALVVEFPEILKGSRNGLSVSVVTPLTLDRVWQIPRLRMAGGAWQEGTATLVVPEGLQIGHLEFTDVRQTSISPGSPTQPEQTVQFQYLSVGGHVEIHPVRNRPLLKVMGGLVVRHESTQLAAVQNLDLGVNSGELFTVEGVTSDEWIIDSVETSPPEVLEERQFIPLDNRKFLLRLRLARPLTTKDRTRLVIRAHRQTPGEGEGITADGLRIVAFHDVLDEQLVVALRATDSSREFQLSGELDLFRIDPESAAPEELSLLEASAAGILIRLDRQGEGSRVSLVPSDPQFTALMESLAVVKRGKVEHSATVRITPTSSSLTRLVLRSSRPLPSAMRWQLRGASDLSIESQTLLPAQSPASGGQKESVWELVLNRITSQPFMLEAVWETPLSPGEVLPLFSVPEATAQDGLVRIEASQGMPLQLETEGVKPVPVSLPSAGFYSPTRSLFRYEPGRQATVRVHTPGKGTAISAAWVRKCVLHSRYALDGAATHEITWKLENHGLDRFPFSLPPGVRPLQITIDEVDATMLPVDASTGQHFVPLPELRRYPEITLTVSTAAPAAPGLLEKRWTAPLVTTSLPVLDRRWEIALPPGVQQVSRTPAAELSGQWYGIWKARMWGVFNPLSEEVSPPFTIPWSESEPLIVSVHAPGLVRILGIALAIAAASLVVWLLPGRLVIVFLLGALSAGAALLLPAAWSPLAAGLFWGLAAGSVLSLVRPHAIALATPSRPAQTTKATMATGMTGIFLLLGAIRIFDSAAIAAPGDQGDSDPPAKIHRVIIPVDADQQPHGDYVYVAPDLYKLLYSAPEREHLPAWLIRSATYEFEASEESSAANILIRFELETLAGQAKISLPLRRGEIHLLEGRAALDGEPILLDWNDAGTSLQMEVERAGLYQLTLRCSAAARQENGDIRWNFSIPKTPRTTLRIKSPTRPSDWVLPGAQGIAANGDQGNDLLAELGSSATLDVIRKDSRVVADNTVEAEQLIWWKIRPGSVTADVVVRLRPVTGKIGEVKLVADPQLHLLPLENEPRVSRVWVEEGESNLVHFVLAEATTETLELRLKFLLLNSSGVGKLAFPRLDVVADRKAKMWQAISVDKEIEINPDPQIPLTTIPPVEFVDSFGGAARPPNLAFEAIKQSPAFFVRPQEGIVRARETMDISLGRLDAEIHYRAELVGIPPRRFQEVIELPPGFHVKQAVILEQEAVASMHGATAQNNLLSIHRAQTPGSAQQVVIHGTLPLSAPAGQPNQVRFPSLRSVASDGSAIRIYRSPATLARIQSAVGIEPSANPEGAPWDKRLGHLVASYKSAPSSFPIAKYIAVVVRPNEPVASYRLVTKMERTAPRAWSAVVQCDVSLESGSLDTVRFEVPSEWSGPFELTPPTDHQVVLLPGQTQRHLIIRPVDGRALKLTLSIRGPIKLQSGETPHAPVLLPLDATRVDSFLLLPRRAADETFQWQTNGLQTLATGELKGVGLEATAYEAFRVVAPHFAATLQSKDSRKNGRIVLADLVVHPTPAAGYWSQANFYLLPGSRDEATLQLPDNSQMVQVLVNDAPAEIRMQLDGTWRVRLCHDQLPQTVNVIYQHDQRSKVTSDSAAPIWPEFPVEKSICSLAKPAAMMNTAVDSLATQESEGLRSATVSQMAAVLEVVRSASDAGVSGLSPRELAAWLSLWRMEFARASQAAQLPASAALQNTIRNPDRLETDRRNLEVEFAATLSRFADLDVASTPPSAIFPPLRADDLAIGPVISTGAPAPLPLASATAYANVIPHIGVSLVLLATALVVATLVWWLPFREWVSASPAYAVLVFAMVCLPSLPSGHLVSIFLVVVAAWFALGRIWPRAYSGAGFRVHFPSTNSRA